jgi:hypothetical protein
METVKNNAENSKVYLYDDPRGIYNSMSFCNSGICCMVMGINTNTIVTKNKIQIKYVQVHKINVKDPFNKEYQRVLKIQ